MATTFVVLAVGVSTPAPLRVGERRIVFGRQLGAEAAGAVSAERVWRVHSVLLSGAKFRASSSIFTIFSSAPWLILAVHLEHTTDSLSSRQTTHRIFVSCSFGVLTATTRRAPPTP